MNRSFWRVLSAAIAATGAVSVLLAFTTLDWYAEQFRPDSRGGASFADLRWLVAYASWAPPLASAYFRWLGWAVLIATLALGIMVAVSTARSASLGGTLTCLTWSRTHVCSVVRPV